MFLDLNAFFASVEQQDHPEWRGKPVVVSAVETDATAAIAASYEAKKFGVKTLMNIGEARRLCPGLIVAPARPQAYVSYHNQVLKAVETVLPIDKVCSIDEMRFRLIGKEREPAEATQLALRMKAAIRDMVGECMTSSIGIAPNSFLAKLATDMQKPDGLVLLPQEEIEARTRLLKLIEFAGINRKMQARLNAAGIFTTEQLYAQDRTQLRVAFGSIIGEKWWYLLRGYEIDEEETERKSISHSHVLPPDLRTDQGCYEVLLRLIQKAAMRLRALNLVTGAMSVGVSGAEVSWYDQTRLEPTSDSLRLNDELARMWKGRDFRKPMKVSVVFSALTAPSAVTPSLFDEAPHRPELNAAVDKLNQKFGKNTLYLAALQRAKDTASEKIAFQKTELFSEGKGDNVEGWPDTFRGPNSP
jgi:DNA polymerase IV